MKPEVDAHVRALICAAMAPTMAHYLVVSAGRELTEPEIYILQDAARKATVIAYAVALPVDSMLERHANEATDPMGALQ